jgi:hypothetical protein
MNLSQERKAIEDEAYRISGRLKIAATFLALGRDDSAFEILTKEIDKFDELSRFLVMLNHQQEAAEPNGTSPITPYH